MANFFGHEFHSLIGHDQQNKRLSRLGMLDGAGAALVNPGNGRDSCFHFREAYPRSPDLQKCSRSSFDPEKTFLILPRQISRVKPTVAKNAESLGFVIEIARTDRRPFHEQFADLTCGDSLALFIDDRDREIVQGLADTPGLLCQRSGSMQEMRAVASVWPYIT